MLIKSHHYPLGGLWWSTPACIKTTITQHSWWSLLMNAHCNLISYIACWDLEALTWLHDHDGTDRSWQVSGIKKVGIKHEIRLHTQTRQSQWTTYAGSQPRWSCCYVSGQRALWKWKWNCYTPTAIEQRICVGWGTTTYSIVTLGEALALPHFKVRLTKRKCSARFIQ